MDIFKTIDEQRGWSRSQRQAGKRIICVPTMGALHEGHISLIKRAQEEQNAVVVVTIYVNPTQFDNTEDLEAYPITLDADIEACAAQGVDAVFMPSDKLMYPQGYATFVEVVGQISETLCAATRPGHFRGVCTVVQKLFHIIEPDAAVFGEKDLQQVMIINRMVADQAIPVEIIVAPTLRDQDGLVKSSRNSRLSAQQREKALSLPIGLARAHTAFMAGERNANDLVTMVAEEVLMHDGVDLDYADAVNLADFSEVTEVELGCMLAVAAFVDGVRLIDHLVFGQSFAPADTLKQDEE